jgi:CRISPR type III-A-associated RAMP protein Csm5
MKGQTETIKLTLEVLTPLHVGSGEELRLDLDYIERGGVPLVVDRQRTLDALVSGDQSLDKVLDGDWNLAELVKLTGQDFGYSLPALVGQGVTPATLRAQLKDAEFRPYIPGSSLKGAIRTALLAVWLQGQGAIAYQSLLPYWDTKKNAPSEKRAAFAAMRLIRSVFGNTPNQDILRALQVSDARFQTVDLRLTDFRWLNIIQVKGKEKTAWRDMASKKNLDIWKDASGLHAETLKPNSTATLTLGWDRFLLSDLTKWGAPAHGVDLLPTDFPTLREILNNHARRILENEVAFFDQYQVTAPKQQLQKLLNQMQQDSEGIYLRLAWGSGWRGMTGDWLDAPSFSVMRELYRLGKGSKDAKGNWQPVGIFPKTRRLAVQGTPCLPLGWVRLGPWCQKVATVQRHPWVEKALTEIQQKNRCQADEALRGAQLADAWQVLSDPELKAAALADIQARWREKGWWDQPPPGKSTKKALAIYQSGAT